jgi:hypothetical protein
MLGQIRLKASVSVSPPIVGYFGHTNFPHALRNSPASGCQSFNMSQLCNDFLGLMFSHSPALSLKDRVVIALRSWFFLVTYCFPVPANLARCADSAAMTASTGDRLNGQDNKGPRGIFIGSESQAHAARLKIRRALAIGSLDAWFGAHHTEAYRQPRRRKPKRE